MKVYLGLGTNLGDKELNLRVALQKIEERIGENHFSFQLFMLLLPGDFNRKTTF